MNFEQVQDLIQLPDMSFSYVEPQEQKCDNYRTPNQNGNEDKQWKRD